MHNERTTVGSSRTGKTPFWGCGGCGFPRNFADRGKCWKCGNRGPASAVAAEKLRLEKQGHGVAEGQGNRAGSSASAWTPGPKAPTGAPWREDKAKTGSANGDAPKPAAGVAAAAREPTDVEKAVELVQLCEKQGLQDSDPCLTQARLRLQEARERRDAAKPVRFRIRDAEARLAELQAQVQTAQEKQAQLQEQLRTAVADEHKALDEAAALNSELAKLRLEQSSSAAPDGTVPGTPQSVHAAVYALVPAERRDDPAVCVLLQQLGTILAAPGPTEVQQSQHPVGGNSEVEMGEAELLGVFRGDAGDEARQHLLREAAAAKRRRIGMGSRASAAPAEAVSADADNAGRAAELGPQVGHRPPGTDEAAARMALDADEASEMPSHAGRYSPY